MNLKINPKKSNIVAIIIGRNKNKLRNFPLFGERIKPSKQVKFFSASSICDSSITEKYNIIFFYH